MKIQIFALGGLNEDGKNLYVVDVNERLFVLDAGIKYPTRELFGIEAIVPDFRVLFQKKEQVEGFFLTHAHEDHIGALAHILKEVNAPVYATNFTMELVKDALIEHKYNLNDFNLITVSHNSMIKFGNVRVSFFKTTHSIPESVGIALETLDGTIVYTGNYSFSQSADELYQTDFQKLSEIAEKDVLLLMTESLGSNNILDGNKNEMFEHYVNRAISNATDRVIITLYSSDLRQIQKVINIALKYDKRVAIIGRKAQRVVDIAIKNDYLSIPEGKLINLRYIDDNNKNDDPDLVCLVTGERHEPYHMLQRMIKKSDRLINLANEDTVVIATSPTSGTEKIAATTINLLYRTEANIEIIDKEYLTGNNATADEIKMMLGILKPQHIMPVIGEYRKLYQVLNISKEMGYDEKQVFLLENGDVLRFDDKRPLIQRNRYRTGDVLIDGAGLGDINDIVVHDRELLSEDGVLICIIHIDPKAKQTLGDVEFITRGFLIDSDINDIKDTLKQLFIDTVDNHLSTSSYVNWNELKFKVRDVINKYLYKELRRRPVTIPVLIAVDDNEKD